MGIAGIWINMVLFVLNLLPLPPLDGSKVMYSLLPPKTAWQLQRYEPFAILIFMTLWFTGLLDYVLSPAVTLVRWVATLFGLSGV